VSIFEIWGFNMRAKGTTISPPASNTINTVNGRNDGPDKSAQPEIFITAVGIAFLILFGVGVMMQVQTNEALVTNAGNVTVYQPDWAIFLQIPELVFGGFASSSDAAGALVGWGIELMYLGFIIGYEHLHHSVKRSGQFMAKAFRFLSFVVLGVNCWTDFKYGSLGGGTWGHILFAAVASVIVGFFGTIGMYLLEIGWKRTEG
jgi:hypothetical protein